MSVCQTDSLLEELVGLGFVVSFSLSSNCEVKATRTLQGGFLQIFEAEGLTWGDSLEDVIGMIPRSEYSKLHILDKWELVKTLGFSLRVVFDDDHIGEVWVATITRHDTGIKTMSGGLSYLDAIGNVLHTLNLEYGFDDILALP